jgi:branched-chain amino acid transport system permease protein
VDAFLAFVSSDYTVHLAVLVCIHLILAQSLNFTFGLGSLLNLSHISVYAIGAYTTALLSTDLQYGIGICLPASMIVAGFFALLIGAISLKLTEEYFAVGTLAFSSVVTALLINWKSLTRGVLGIPGIPRPVLFGTELISNRQFLLLSAAVAAVLLCWLRLLFRSRLSRALRAQSEHVPAAQSVGYSIKSVNSDAFIVSSICVGAAGSLFAYYINYIDPSSFGLNEMVFVLSIVVVGRPGSFWGCVFATVFLVLLPEPLRFIDLEPSILGPMRQMLYAWILFGVIFWKRASLFPKMREI